MPTSHPCCFRRHAQHGAYACCFVLGVTERASWLQGDDLDAGDLLVLMEEGPEPANPMKSLDAGDMGSDGDGAEDDPDAVKLAAMLAEAR
jgi:hypothetical protein